MNPKILDNWLLDPHRPALLMGILNLTRDSFSDGGEFLDTTAAINHASQMRDEGAAWIDIGAESTRPGAQPVSAAEQIRRVIPIIQAIRPLNIITSVDTTSAQVAEAALDAGAMVINDISAGRFDPAMLPLAAHRQTPIILMHIQGTPATMQQNPTYSDVVAEVADHLRQRRDEAIKTGIAPHRILLDPGIGFGKTIDHNLLLLRHMQTLVEIGQPLVIGTSRKAFIGKITGEQPANQRLFGTAATVAWAAEHGAAVLRVHDVKPMMATLKMSAAIADIHCAEAL